ncbi:hypothetical protein BRADI_1g51206v3 [Brachypodium distachyon]|uniref:Uncharacterized protein n=1 Tax=Brachypodium distachyon TaxID=15368 RepID=A0A2K2DQV9_BRADI|nr:hypothetical protein BRADI_1g51206v3 [Brachypodium distachyon]
MMKAHPFRCHLHIQRPESMDVCFHNVVMEVLTAAKNILPNPSLESGTFDSTSDVPFGSSHVT